MGTGAIVTLSLIGCVTLVAIVAISMFEDIFPRIAGARSRKFETAVKPVLERLDQIEERVANLETIVLDQEKEKEFANLGQATA